VRIINLSLIEGISVLFNLKTEGGIKYIYFKFCENLAPSKAALSEM
jgi:hypothetical protein